MAISFIRTFSVPLDGAPTLTDPAGTHLTDWRMESRDDFAQAKKINDPR